MIITISSTISPSLPSPTTSTSAGDRTSSSNVITEALPSPLGSTGEPSTAHWWRRPTTSSSPSTKIWSSSSTITVKIILPGPIRWPPLAPWDINNSSSTLLSMLWRPIHVFQRIWSDFWKGWMELYSLLERYEMVFLVWLVALNLLAGAPLQQCYCIFSLLYQDFAEPPAHDCPLVAGLSSVFDFVD